MANHKKKDFLEKLAQYPLSKRIYLDQSGINKAVGRHYGYSLRGKPVYGKKSGKRYARENFMAALRGKEIIAPFCYSGSCNTRLFNAWLEHRLTKINHPWTNGQVERMNRTLKEATVKKYYYKNHEQLKEHMYAFVNAYNYAKRLKTLKGLTPCEEISKNWKNNPEYFRVNPNHHNMGLNI